LRLFPAKATISTFGPLHRGQTRFSFKEVTPVQLQPIDVTEIIAVFMGISIVLIPVIGLTARFAIKPVVEALSRGLESRGQDETVRILERRVGLLEAQVEAMEHSVARVEEAKDFEAQLRQPAPSENDQLPPP
jgi:hypothetical protein